MGRELGIGRSANHGPGNLEPASVVRNDDLNLVRCSPPPVDLDEIFGDARTEIERYLGTVLEPDGCHAAVPSTADLCETPIGRFIPAFDLGGDAVLMNVTL